jgi:hypothetical protein
MGPLSIALGGLGALGALKTKRDADRQAQATVDAQNETLEQFLLRNQGYAKQSRGAFDQRMGQVTPDQMFATMGASEASRGAAGREAAAAVPRMAMPTKASVAPIMSPEMDAARTREMGVVDQRIGAQAKLDSFGDLVFDLGQGNMRTGRKVGMTADIANADAQMLPMFQELAGGSAALRNRSRGIGDIMSGVATGAASYFGSR